VFRHLRRKSVASSRKLSAAADLLACVPALPHIADPHLAPTSMLATALVNRRGLKCCHFDLRHA
jgi:hypothetical protein